jgi:hypothetical protein
MLWELLEMENRVSNLKIRKVAVLGPVRLPWGSISPSTSAEALSAARPARAAVCRPGPASGWSRPTHAVCPRVVVPPPCLG